MWCGTAPSITVPLGDCSVGMSPRRGRRCKRRQVVRLFPRAVLAASSALSLAACEVCVEPSYTGKATDEAYLSFLDVEKDASTDDSKAALFTLPASGSDAPLAATGPAFEWTSGLMAHAPRAVPTTSPLRRAWNELGLGTAHAHGTPMVGPGHLVRLKVQGLQCPVQHFTSNTFWNVTATEWQRLSTFKGKSLTVDVVSAYFQSNRVTEGPFKPSSQLSLQLVP